MNLEIKRKEISQKLRKADKQDYFNKIRMSLLSQYGDLQSSNIQLTPNGQQQILESIVAFRKNKQFLSFQAINNYITNFQGQLSQDFRFEVGRTVLESFRANGHAIACLAHILTQADENNWLLEIEDLKEKSELLIQENIEEDQRSMRNFKGIAFLLFGLINSCQNKHQFDFLPKYYQFFAESGYFDEGLLLVLETASHIRQLHPSEEFVHTMLAQEIVPSQIEPDKMLIFCEFMENYICYNISEDLYIQLSYWIERRLKQKKFSMYLKQRLVKIITRAISYMHIVDLINKENGVSKLFLEISNFARFGGPVIKEEALLCIIGLVRVLIPEKVDLLVENNQLLEILIFALEISLDFEIVYKILEAIVTILSQNPKHVKIARQYGLLNQATRYHSSEVIKLSTISGVILQIFCDN